MQKPNAASDCALKAFTDSKAFYVSYDQRAWSGGYTVGFAGDRKGNLYFAEYMNEGWPPQPPSESVHVSDDNHIRFGPCPEPPVLFKVHDGELTCIRSAE